jgi:GntR family transcriptional regulator/MocR family aminotransferase
VIYIDKSSPLPLYRQIYRQIQSYIVEGRLLPGHKLTGSRTLSQQLGVGRNTVDSAYAQLAAEGYIEARQGAGFIVQALPTLKELGAERQIKRQTIAPDPTEAPAVRYDLSYGSFSHRFFPAALWKKYTTQAVVRQQIGCYQDRQGDPFLRETLVDYLYQTRGVRCNASQIVITCGLQHSISVLSQLLYPQGGAVAIEEPGYNGAAAVFKNHRVQLCSIPLDHQGIRVDRLPEDKAVNAVYVTPSHQFPTGIIMPVTRRYELLNWAVRNDAYILEDDYDSEYSYYTNPIPSLQSIDQADRVIYLGTFSKSLSPSMRIGYMVLPKRLLKRYAEKMGEYHCSASWMSQFVIGKMIDSGHYGRHVRRLCTIFRKRHDVLVKALAEMSPELRVCHPGAGLTFQLQFPPQMDYQWLIERARRQGIKVQSTYRYWQNKDLCPQNVLFIGFGAIDIEDIPDCIARLKRAWFIESHAV